MDFLVPNGVSNKWIKRFKILEFIIDGAGCLYSPKTWNDGWDNQTKALWLRSVGVTPQNIAKKLNVELTTVKNRWIDTITRNYKLKIPDCHDWTNIGYVDNYLHRHINNGGVPEMPEPQLDMDGELLQTLHDYRDED